MRNGQRKFIATFVAVGAMGLLTARQLFAESGPAAPATATAARTGSNRTDTAAARFVEVRAGTDTWQGIDLGRRRNTLLLLTRDGQLRQVQFGDVAEMRELTKPPVPATQNELALALGKEFGPKFQIVRTAHYVVCHNTEAVFAREAADLMEELYRAFTSYFTSRGMKLSKPQYPLIVLIFDDEPEFRSYMARSSGESDLKRIAGYYSIETNRVAFFNAAGKDAAKYGNARWHNLTTIVHEATHQIAFNSGCHRRFADNPLWLVEGLAMYFEAPEVKGTKIAWKEIGRLNQPRLDRFASFRRKGRPADSLRQLISSDDRFRADPAASEAYAESWALCYFLIQTRPAQFYRYLKTIAAKPTLVADTPEQRLEDFRAAFGKDLRLLEASFLRHIDEELLAKN